MTDETDHDYIKEQAENHLNIKLREFDQLEVEEYRNGLWNVNIKIPADETSDGSFYQLRVCEECGHAQSMNFEAYLKQRPQEARDLLEQYRREQAEDYIENGDRPVEGDVLRNRIARKHLNWNNSRCEQRHPPQA